MGLKMNDILKMKVKNYIKVIDKQKELFEEVMALNEACADGTAIRSCGSELNSTKAKAEEIMFSITGALNLDVVNVDKDWTEFNNLVNEVRGEL